MGELDLEVNFLGIVFLVGIMIALVRFFINLLLGVYGFCYFNGFLDFRIFVINFFVFLSLGILSLSLLERRFCFFMFFFE